MSSNLAVGLNTAKGLAVAWDVPLLAVNHMQAHALTPRLVSALARGGEDGNAVGGEEGLYAKEPTNLKDQVVSTSLDFLTFGHGRHAWYVYPYSLSAR